MNTRRDLLTAALGALALPASFPAALELRGADPRPQPARDPAFEISLAQWSLHRTLGTGELDPLDFPSITRSRYGLGAVEYVNSFYRGRATDFEYLGQLRQRCADAGVTSLLIMVDGEGQLGAADDAERRTAVLKHVRWIAAAGFLGCHSIRVNAGGNGDLEEHSRRAADSLHQLAVVGADYDLSILVENHGGPSSDGAWLAKTLERADHAGVGSLPDFGNFRVSGDRWYDRYRGVAELMPFAKAVSAKSHDFDEAGEETGTDYARMLGIVRDAGYSGYIGIEYEGSRLSEHEGILATQRLLERLRERP